MTPSTLASPVAMRYSLMRRWACGVALAPWAASSSMADWMEDRRGWWSADIGTDTWGVKSRGRGAGGKEKCQSRGRGGGKEKCQSRGRGGGKEKCQSRGCLA
jgi:hypothetical protein